MGKGVKRIRDSIRGTNKSLNQSVNLTPKKPGADGDDFVFMLSIEDGGRRMEWAHIEIAFSLSSNGLIGYQ
jgi:hypothetical protein